MAALGWVTGLLLTRISRPSCRSFNSLGHREALQRHKVQAGSHLRRHMTRWLCYGQHSQARQVFWGSGQGMTSSYWSTGYSGRLIHEQRVR